MRLLVAALAAASTIALATSASGETRDALTPWEGSSSLTGALLNVPVVRVVPMTLRLEMRREADKSYRTGLNTKTTHLRGTAQRCITAAVVETCGAPVPIIIRQVSPATTELRVIKTRTMKRLVSPVLTETYEEEIGEETIGTLHTDPKGGYVIGDNLAAFGALTAPAYPDRDMSAGMSGR